MVMLLADDEPALLSGEAELVKACAEYKDGWSGRGQMRTAYLKVLQSTKMA